MKIGAVSYLVLALGLCLLPALALAGPKDAVAAAKADKEGQAFEKKKSWEEARAAYQKSLELRENVETRFRLAGVEDKLGHLVEASAENQKVLEAKNISFALRMRAKARAKQLEKRVPTLALELPNGFSGTVRVDGRELGAQELSGPIRVNPGKHEVKAEAEGMKPFSETVSLEEKETKNLTILMTEAPKVESTPAAAPDGDAGKKKGGDKTLAYISLGVGAAGVIVGTVFALQAKSTKSDLDGKCRNGVCSEAERDLYDKGKNQANVATAGFVVGAVGLGLGTVLLLSSGGGKEGKKPEARRVSPYVGPGSLGFAGRF